MTERTYPPGTKMTRCADCGERMPAARKRIGILNCTPCRDAQRITRPVAPEYETVVWSRGGRL